MKRAEDERAALWFEAGVAAYPKAASYEAEGNIDKGELSRMRSGKIATALRRLLPMQNHAPSALAFCEAFLADVSVDEHPDAVLALVAPLLDAIGYVARPAAGPSRGEVLELSHAESWDAPMFREHLYRRAEARGWTREQVDAALRGAGAPTDPNEGDPNR